MTLNPSTAHEHLVELEIASHVKRVRTALVLVGALYAWAAYGNYVHLSPWRDGSMFASPPTGEIKRMIAVAYFIILFTVIASVANVALAAIAGKKTRFVSYAAMGIFAGYTALRVYQTDGRFLASWLWWLTTIVLGVAIQAAYKAIQLRRSARLANARLVV